MNYIDNQKQTIAFVTEEMYTMEVAKVLSFDPSTCSATVQFLMKRLYSDGETDETPMTLFSVPVRYPQMGNFTMYAPLVPDDVVYLHFSRTDWDNWLTNKNNSDTVLPDGVDKHTFNCPYIEVGARNLSNPARDARFTDRFHLVQGDGGEQYITMADDGIVINTGTTQVAITPSGTINITGNIVVQGTVTATDFLTSTGGSFKTHQHTYNDNGTPTPTTTPIVP